MPRWIPILLLAICAPRSAHASSFDLGFAFEWRRTNFGQYASGMVFLALPLDRLAQPRLPRVVLRAPSRLQEGPPGEPAPAPVPPASTLPVKSPPPRSPLVNSALARRLVRAALRARGAFRADERLDSLVARSRASSALPELTLRAVRSTDESLRLSPSASYVGDYTQTGGAGLLLEARATWKLDRLLFADEELRVERLRTQREQMSDRLVAAVLKQLGTWQRAQTRLLDQDVTPEEQLQLEIEQLEAEAALDVLTEGLFSQERNAQEAGSAAPSRAVPPAPSSP